MQNCPIPNEYLIELFDAVDGKICAHDFCHTRNFAKKNKFDEEKVIKWLHSCGASCDCQVFSRVDSNGSRKW